MPTNEELEDLVHSLQTTVSTLSRRIGEMEDFAATHIGMDWGTSQVTVNSSHPNLSVDTIESGGGLVRQDLHGMQVLAPNGNVSIYWVPRFTANPEPDTGSFLPRSSIEGRADSASDLASIAITADSSDASGQTGITAETGSVYFQVSLDGGTPEDANLRVYHSNTARTLSWNGGISFASGAVLTPAQITSNQNDYNPTGLLRSSVLRLSTDASRDITGLAMDGDGSGNVQFLILVFNVGSFNIVLKDESASSTAANRFALNGDITLQPDNSCGLWYDATDSRWRAF